MKLVVLDPGLDSTAGHHYHLDLVLREQGTARGMDVQFYGFKDMDPLVAEQFDMRLVFDMHCYAQVPSVPEIDADSQPLDQQLHLSPEPVRDVHRISTPTISSSCIPCSAINSSAFTCGTATWPSHAHAFA